MPAKLKNKAKMVYMPAEEAERLVAQVSKSGSSAGSRYAAPASIIRKIPMPKGSAGRSGGSRPGYNLEDAMMLTKEQHAMLRLTVQRFVYKYCDVTKLYDKNKMGHKVSVITCCLEYHPWLAHYEEEWPVAVIMRQILVKTSHNYCFEDWGDEELLEKMREREDADDSDESDDRTPLPKARATKSSTSKSSSKSSASKSSSSKSSSKSPSVNATPVATKFASSANKTPSTSSSKKKAAPLRANTYKSNTPVISTKSKTTATTSHCPNANHLKFKKPTKKKGVDDEAEAEESNADEDDEDMVADQTDSDEDTESKQEQEQEEQEDEQEGGERGVGDTMLDDAGEEIGDLQGGDNKDDKQEQPPTPSPAAHPLRASHAQVSPAPTPTISIAATFASQAPPPLSKPPAARINTAQKEKVGATTGTAGKGKGRAVAAKPAAKPLANASKAQPECRTSKCNADNANILHENVDSREPKRLRREDN